MATTWKDIKRPPGTNPLALIQVGSETFRLPLWIAGTATNIDKCPYDVRLTVRFDLHTHQAYCDALTITQTKDADGAPTGPPVTATDVRTVPVATLVDQLARRATERVKVRGQRDGRIHASVLPTSEDERRDPYRQWRSEDVDGRQKMTDDFLRRVAEVVMRPETRYPTATVRDVIGGGTVHRNTARRWIKAAQARFGENFEHLEDDHGTA